MEYGLGALLAMSMLGNMVLYYQASRSAKLKKDLDATKLALKLEKRLLKGVQKSSAYTRKELRMARYKYNAIRVQHPDTLVSDANKLFKDGESSSGSDAVYRAEVPDPAKAD